MSSEEQAGQESVTPPRWGERLRAARESQVMSESQVATQLNLPEDYIRILESGSVERLPSLVFARGYVRAYARLLKLDDDALVDEFDQSQPDAASGRGQQIKSVTRVRQQARVNDPVVRLFTWIFVLGIIGVTFWWWQTQSGSALVDSQVLEQQVPVEGTETVTVSEDGKLSLPPLADGDAVGPAVNEVVDGAATEPEPEYLTDAEVLALQDNLETEAAAVAGDAPVIEAQGGETQPEIEAVAEPAEPVAQGLVIEFSADCWVSVRDASGQRLISDLRRQGQSLKVEGTPPLQVILGAADAVARLTYNGQQIDLQPYNRENVVKLTLPLSE